MSMHPDIADVLAGRRRWCVVTGDCLDILSTLPDGCVDAVVTDPPYSSGSASASTIGRSSRAVPDTQFFEVWLAQQVAEWVRVTTSVGSFWLTLDWRGCLAFERVTSRAGLMRPPAIGVWDKKRIGMGGRLRRRYDTFVVQDKNDRPTSTTGEPDVWECSWGGPEESEHSSEKPVELMARALRLVAPKGALILDPFCGSGSTGVAAVQMGYRFLGIEREPAYCDIARRRITEADTHLFNGVGA